MFAGENRLISRCHYVLNPGHQQVKLFVVADAFVEVVVFPFEIEEIRH